MNGFAAYYAGVMVGFCNADKKDSYFRISRDKSPEIWSKDEDGSKTLSIVCFTIEPRMRGKRIASAMLEAACRYAAENGYRCIESYPSEGEFSQENCCGHVSMYVKQGFQVHNTGKGIVVRKEL